MKIFFVMFATDFTAPELGYWFLCRNMEEVTELAKVAKMPRTPAPTDVLPGDWVEATNGGMVESLLSSGVMKVVEFDTEDPRVSHEMNIKALREILKAQEQKS
jgi:hypothetical protein